MLVEEEIISVSLWQPMECDFCIRWKEKLDTFSDRNFFYEKLGVKKNSKE